MGFLSKVALLLLFRLMKFDRIALYSNYMMIMRNKFLDLRRICEWKSYSFLHFSLFEKFVYLGLCKNYFGFHKDSINSLFELLLFEDFLLMKSILHSKLRNSDPSSLRRTARHPSLVRILIFFLESSLWFPRVFFIATAAPLRPVFCDLFSNGSIEKSVVVAQVFSLLHLWEIVPSSVTWLEAKEN